MLLVLKKGSKLLFYLLFIIFFNDYEVICSGLSLYRLEGGIISASLIHLIRGQSDENTNEQ